MEEFEDVDNPAQTIDIPINWLTIEEVEDLDGFFLNNWGRVCEQMKLDLYQTKTLEQTKCDRFGKLYPNNGRKLFDYFVNRFEDNSLNALRKLFDDAKVYNGRNYIHDLIMVKTQKWMDKLQSAGENEVRTHQRLRAFRQDITIANTVNSRQTPICNNRRYDYQSNYHSFERNNMECEDVSQRKEINKCKNSGDFRLKSSSVMRNDSSQIYAEENGMECDYWNNRQMSTNMNWDNSHRRDRSNGLGENNFSNAMDCQTMNESTESELCNSSVSPKNIKLPEDLGKIYARNGYNTGTFPNACKKNKKTHTQKPIGLSTNTVSTPSDYCLSQPVSFKDLSKFRSRVLIAYDSSDKKNMDKITNIACWLIKNKFRVEFDDFKADLVKQTRDDWMSIVYKDAPFVLLCITPSFEKNLLKGKDTALRKIWDDIVLRLKKDPLNREGNSIVPLLISPAKRVPSILRTIVHYKWKDDWQSLSFFLSAPYKLPVNKDSKNYSNV